MYMGNVHGSLEKHDVSLEAHARYLQQGLPPAKRTGAWRAGEEGKLAFHFILFCAL